MLALLVASVVIQAPFTLALNPAVKDAWTLEMSERFHNAAEEFDETDVWREEYQVLERTESGARVSLKRTFLYTELDGNRIPPAKGNEPIQAEQSLRVVGGHLPFSEANQPISQVRVERLEAQGVWYPEGKVGTGNRWGLEHQRDGQVPSAKASWWIVRVEEFKERKCAVVGFRFVEDPVFDYPMTANGERWVDVDTGVIVGERVTTTNYPIPGGSFRVDRTVVRTLQKWGR